MGRAWAASSGTGRLHVPRDPRMPGQRPGLGSEAESSTVSHSCIIMISIVVVIWNFGSFQFRLEFFWGLVQKNLLKVLNRAQFKYEKRWFQKTNSSLVSHLRVKVGVFMKEWNTNLKISFSLSHNNTSVPFRSGTSAKKVGTF